MSDMLKLLSSPASSVVLLSWCKFWTAGRRVQQSECSLALYLLISIVLLKDARPALKKKDAVWMESYVVLEAEYSFQR